MEGRKPGKHGAKRSIFLVRFVKSENKSEKHGFCGAKGFLICSRGGKERKAANQSI